MTGALALLKLASMLTLIGIVAPLFGTVLVGETTGLGVAGTLIVFVSWFIQGIVIFALPLMLVVRLGHLQTMKAHVIAATAIMLIISMGLWFTMASGASVSFSVWGTVLFFAGAAGAGFYLFRRRSALSRTV